MDSKELAQRLANLNDEGNEDSFIDSDDNFSDYDFEDDAII